MRKSAATAVAGGNRYCHLDVVREVSRVGAGQEIVLVILHPFHRAAIFLGQRRGNELFRIDIRLHPEATTCVGADDPEWNRPAYERFGERSPYHVRNLGRRRLRLPQRP